MPTETLPLVTCIMPTADRPQFVAQAIRYFLRQDYAAKELIIVDDGRAPVGALVPADERVRYLRLEAKLPVGAKRNLACEAARGEIIAHWDDDDWHAPHRLSYQVKSMVEARAELCGIKMLLFYDPRGGGRAWRYSYPPSRKAWVSGSSMCYTREFWAGTRFREIDVGEDARFVWSRPAARLCVLPDPSFHVGIIHKANVSPKNTAGSYWQAHPVEDIRRLFGADAQFYDDLAAGKDAHRKAETETCGEARVEASGAARGADAPAALVSAAYGIGDILRVTPLVRALAGLGYQVDLLVAPDYPESVKLWEGAPEIRRLIHYQNFRANRGGQPCDALAQTAYEVATFTQWSAPLRRWVRARRTFAFKQSDWLKEGDIACVLRMARELGWQEELPEPFAVASERRFDLPAGTIALHPGCKPDWPWKKWHGFDELARLWPHVAVIGTNSDLQNAETYFRRDFKWPEHAQSFVGALDLPDTAALIKQSAALVSNDSGLMHLGVALGTPTFGVFGITSPAREMIPSRRMFPVTKKLPCEAACRRGAWGRRDCERHLECLKTLSAEEVLANVKQNVPALDAALTLQTSHTAEARAQVSAKQAVAAAVPAQVAAPPVQTQTASPPRRAPARDKVSLIYYGYVFDASGYGQAARGYIHALERAGVKLSVVDLASNRARQVRDELVESRLVSRGATAAADAHLFHGIPPHWGRFAAGLKNSIGMTVWETDSMPAQWRAALAQVREVWLPCDYNVSVFQKSLDKQFFKLPHPLLSETGADTNGAEEFPGLSASDFVFYSIFQWQERKSPQGLIESFLRAFPAESDAVLVLKVNAEAARLAASELARLRRLTASRARVEIHGEVWPERRIEALHAHGDCYVSLHRGEGWCYPLFEAAGRGTPVVATGYSGPLEYLDPQAHSLVRHGLCPVRQPYVYYHSQMRWAEPDLLHAAELMRSVYEEREAARERARRAARKLREDYSLERVGEMARARIERLLGRSGDAAWSATMTNDDTRTDNAQELVPDVPIPGEWYDADYFEHGRKSNWDRGYSWPLFSELFKQTAVFLCETFPEAESFLDAGCAKGFLVRALRERGKDAHGFDHSPWAIRHAEPSAAAYLKLAQAESVEYEREFDLTVAFSLCESLTEEQAHEFLTRARLWTRQAIVACIPSFESEEEAERFRRNDRDRSHITMRTRAWWHAEFLRAGWRQDALHRIVERACRQHELPRRMNWQLYVYAPA
ncbi:MAG TPA: glycosyltransferase [Pyrinomonadaceae bacterium]|nr:glycosyltransferase [Pyrinomonadaceae bacterium]